MTPKERIRHQLGIIYGIDAIEETFQQILDVLIDYQHRFADRINSRSREELLSEKDIILITYGDQFQEEGNNPLQALNKFMVAYLPDEVSGIHILPFYPYSSDDGFSVINYREVDSNLGRWDDIHQLNIHHDLMFDAVINHISRESDWFKSFIEGIEPYSSYFIELKPDIDLSNVVRPRAHPLLTPVSTNSGEKYVWTTFSTDQVDINYANPKVLIEIIDLLLYYVSQGARFIRLDAIAYLWKEVGTPSIHLPQTHAVVKLFRALLDEIAPDVMLITETNVPHEDNISYYGEVIPGEKITDEAQLVYQFPLAPLILHTFRVGDVKCLNEWAERLSVPAPFFNFIASHDGIGLLPASGVLAATDIDALVEQTISHGGYVSYRSNPDGTESVYELNITLYDALNDAKTTSTREGVGRFLASQAIMLSLAGVPGIYVHSLFGSNNCKTCVVETGRERSINREKLLLSELEHVLENHDSRPSMVFRGYKELLRARKSHPSFHPNGRQEIIDLHSGIFSLLRYSPGGDMILFSLTNVTDKNIAIMVDKILDQEDNASEWSDLLTRKVFNLGKCVEIQSYQTLWLTPIS